MKFSMVPLDNEATVKRIFLSPINDTTDATMEKDGSLFTNVCLCRNFPFIMS